MFLVTYHQQALQVEAIEADQEIIYKIKAPGQPARFLHLSAHEPVWQWMEQEPTPGAAAIGQLIEALTL